MIERYKDSQIEAIWCDEAKYWRWFAIEVENMRQVAGDELADTLTAVGPPSAGAVREWERRTRHDVMAFLEALDSKILTILQTGPSNASPRAERLRGIRAWLHYELTSSDVTDTAMHMALAESQQLLMGYAGDLVEALGGAIKVARATGNGSTIGRTHGQWAVPIPADHPWRVLWDMLSRTIATFSRCTPIRGKLSGPVGTQGGRSERDALTQLGLYRVNSTQLIPRDMMVHWINALIGMLDVCEAIATKVWMLAQQEVGEVREGQPAFQIGSSAMPHKRNPIRSEHIRGLCRMARGYAAMLTPSVVQWGEHDLAHSSVERVALPDLCHVAARILTQTHVLLANLEFVGDTTWSRVSEHWFDTHAALAQLQQEGVPYVEAHARLRDSYQGGKIDGQTDTQEAHGTVRS